jgi:hypothetical protein
VVVEHGGGGSTVAAPIARDILHATLLRFRDQPDSPSPRLAERPA